MTELAQAAPSALIAERYRLVEHVGAGRAGSVWSAVDLRLRRAVAVRLVRLDGRDAATVVGVAASGWAPGMARVYDAGTTAGHAYLVREFVAGASLDARVDAGRVPVATVAAAGACVAGTLAALHLQALAHGAVHGGNIVLSAVADERPDVYGSTATLTDFGLRAGTRGVGPRPADDVRGLGETLLGAVTARRVVGSRTSLAALRRLAREPALRSRERPGWTDLLAAMTADDPSARPSAATVAADLAALAREAATRGSTIRARGPVGHRPPPWDAVFAL